MVIAQFALKHVNNSYVWLQLCLTDNLFDNKPEFSGTNAELNYKSNKWENVKWSVISRTHAAVLHSDPEPNSGSWLAIVCQNWWVIANYFGLSEANQSTLHTVVRPLLHEKAKKKKKTFMNYSDCCSCWINQSQFYGNILDLLDQSVPILWECTGAVGSMKKKN